MCASSAKLQGCLYLQNQGILNSMNLPLYRMVNSSGKVNMNGLNENDCISNEEERRHSTNPLLDCGKALGLHYRLAILNWSITLINVAIIMECKPTAAVWKCILTQVNRNISANSDLQMYRTAFDLVLQIFTPSFQLCWPYLSKLIVANKIARVFCTSVICIGFKCAVFRLKKSYPYSLHLQLQGRHEFLISAS